jgi:hypothetical protein
MDKHRHKIIVALIFIIAMHWVIAQVVALQWVPIGQHWSMMSVMLFSMEFVDIAPRVHNVWSYEKVMGYMKN